MPSLNVDITYFEHRKTKRLIGMLGKDADVLPIRLWAYCARVHPANGRLAGYSAAEIESICNWRGREGAMIEAMVSVKFLVPIKNGFQVHQWREHEGHIVSFSVRAKKGAKARWDKVSQAMLEASSKQSSSNAPNHTKPNLTHPPNGSGGKKTLAQRREAAIAAAVEKGQP